MKKARKLVLHRETLRALNSLTLRRVGGGTWTEGTECMTFIYGTCGASQDACSLAAACTFTANC